VTITPIAGTNFYSDNAPVTITYTKAKTDVTAALLSDPMTIDNKVQLDNYYSVPTNGFNSTNLMYQVHNKANSGNKTILDGVNGT
jgi:hypothetical protein